MKSVGQVMVAASLPVQPKTSTTDERSLGFGVAVCLCAATAIMIVVGILGRVAKAPSRNADERVNPNTASASSLIRLPGIGWSKAQAMVARREQLLATTQAPPAFRDPGDLMQVPGIGPKTVEAISVWLDFNEPQVRSELTTSTPAD